MYLLTDLISIFTQKSENGIIARPVAFSESTKKILASAGYYHIVCSFYSFNFRKQQLTCPIYIHIVLDYFNENPV
jgi:hypothetical protein